MAGKLIVVGERYIDPGWAKDYLVKIAKKAAGITEDKKERPCIKQLKEISIARRAKP